MSMSIEERISVMRFHAINYYNGSPSLSNEEFDLEELELKKILGSGHPLFTTGYGYHDSGCDFKHTRHMGSLPKVKYGDLSDYRFDGWVSPKIDGASATCYYEGGNLVRVLSRGDGEYGKDITSNLVASGSVPLVLKEQYTGYVKGEVAIPYTDFLENMEGSHPRNKASGLSQSKYASKDELKFLKFIAFETDLVAGKFESNRFLHDLGFYITDLVHVSSYVEVASLDFTNSKNYKGVWSKYYRNGKAYDIDLPLDGLVYNPQVDLESDRLAIKFKEEEAESEVIGTFFSLSRTQRLVPVTLIKPVDLSGAMIKRVTSNNISYLTSMGLGKGAKVKIIRANEIIPYVSEVLERSDDFDIPHECPVCSTLLERHDSDLKCVNTECPSIQINTAWSVFCSRRIKGAGYAYFEKIWSSCLESNPQEPLKELLTTDNWDAPDGVIGDKCVLTIDEVRNTKFTIQELVSFCNLSKVGWRSGEYLMMKFTVTDFIRIIHYPVASEEFLSLLECITTLPGRRSFSDNINRVRELCKYLNLCDYAHKDVDVAHKVTITGKLSMPRKALMELWAAHGVVEVKVKECDILICDGPSNSSKYKTALKLGKKMMTEAEFSNMLGIT